MGIFWGNGGIKTVKEIYAGVGGDVKTVKEVYAGLNGVPKLVWAKCVVGEEWQTAFLPSTARWRSVTYGNGNFVAVTYNDSKASYSTDGVIWEATTLPSIANWRSVTYGEGKYVADANSRNNAAYST